MKVLVVISALLAVSAAHVGPYTAAYAGVPWAGSFHGYGAQSYGYLGHPYSPYSYNHAPVSPAYSVVNHKYPAVVPHSYKPAVAHAYAPALPHAYGPAASQYHSQDVLGGYSYGYTDGQSSKTETRNPHGATVGSYSYIDSNGKTQTVNYVADAGGFRVAATNLPVAAAADKTEQAAAPEPVQETAEVKAAREEFEHLYEEAAAAADAAPDTDADASHAKYYHRRRRSVPKPVEDTPAVKAAKAQHAYLYNQAAAAAAAAPDYGYGHGYAGYGHGYAGHGHGYAGYGHGYAGYGHGYAGYGHGYAGYGYPYGVGHGRPHSAVHYKVESVDGKTPADTKAHALTHKLVQPVAHAPAVVYGAPAVAPVPSFSYSYSTPYLYRHHYQPYGVLGYSHK